MIQYGNRFLEEQLGVVNQNEFMIIGSATSVGKTTFANMLVWGFVKQGLKPCFISIENTAGDTVKLAAFKEWKKLTSQWDYKRSVWESNLRDVPDSIMVSALEESMKKLEEIVLVENEGHYSLAHLQESLDKAKNQGCDIIVLDHIDYIFGTKENEYRDMNDILLSIKQFVDINKIPVIAFSQLASKIDPKVIIPTEYDLFGSRNKAKFATSVVIMARDFDNEDRDKGLYPVFFCLRKGRYDGIKNSAVRVQFDIRTGEYDFSHMQKVLVSADGRKIKEVF